LDVATTTSFNEKGRLRDILTTLIMSGVEVAPFIGDDKGMTEGFLTKRPYKGPIRVL
jgi:hypothetical protein